MKIVKGISLRPDNKSPRRNLVSSKKKRIYICRSNFIFWGELAGQISVNTSTVMSPLHAIDLKFVAALSELALFLERQSVGAIEKMRVTLFTFHGQARIVRMALEAVFPLRAAQSITCARHEYRSHDQVLKKMCCEGMLVVSPAQTKLMRSLG